MIKKVNLEIVSFIVLVIMALAIAFFLPPQDKLPVRLILIFLLAVIMLSLKLLINEKTRDSYMLFGSVLLMFVIVYSVGVLEYDIDGDKFGVKKAKRQIDVKTEKSLKEIANVSNTLLKIAAGTTFVTEISPEQQQKIKEYEDSLKTHLDTNTFATLQETISGFKVMTLECKEELKKK